MIGSGTETFRTQQVPPARTVKKTTGKKYFGGGDYDILTFAYNESTGGQRLAAAVRWLSPAPTQNYLLHSAGLVAPNAVAYISKRALT